MKVGSEYYWYHNDHLGTPQVMTTSSGAVVWSARYSSFGEVQALPGSEVTNNLRFGGQHYDSETGLHYNRYRYYDPEVGRYIRTDPIRASINFYAYGYNNPLFFIDPFGLDADAVFLTWIKGGAYYRNGIIRRKPMSREYERQGLEFLSKFALALSKLESDGVDVHALTDEELDEIYNAVRDYYRGVYATATSTVFCLHGILQKLKNAAPKKKFYSQSDAPEIQRKLPQTRHGDPLTDVDVPHSQIGRNRAGEPSAREWMYDKKGNLTATRRIDFTDHGTPDIHPYPHQHTLTPNNPNTAPKGGYVPGKAEPLVYP